MSGNRVTGLGLRAVALGLELGRSVMVMVRVNLTGFPRYRAKGRPGLNRGKQESESLLPYADCCGLV